jgi:protein O-GlcNAc transferase
MSAGTRMPINVSKTILKAKSLAKKGDIAAAAQLFTTVLQQFPQNKQAAQGLASLDKVRTPETPESRQLLQQELRQLVILFNEGQLQRTLDVGAVLARRYPDEPLIYNVLGAAQKSLRNYEAAIANFKKAIRLQPDYAEAHSNLGAAYHDLRMYSEAIASYSKATRHAPRFFEAYYNLGSVLMESGKRDEAISAFTSAIRIKPDYGVALGGLLFQLAQICDWDAIQPHAASLSTLGTSGEKVHPFAMLPMEDIPSRHRLRSEIYTKSTFPQRELPPLACPEEVPRRLRVGYFSADFHDHATMYLMARLFELHDRNAFIIHAYSYGVASNDSMRNRLIDSIDEFHEVSQLSDLEVARLARSHDIDIAVDLKGYTQFSRLGIFAYRAAPVQISYLGYPGTTGSSFMDYIIADQVVIPDGQEVNYSEKIIYLPHSYQVNDSSRAISDQTFSRSECGLPEKAFVFCCFNNNFKIGPREFDIWMRLLQQVQDSVLWLFGSGESAQENLRKQCEKRGVDPLRVIFAERLSHAEHLARHSLADLFLDTFNYNAHTTASDALWTGLPVVTKSGQGFPARVAASLLSAVDLTELITGTESEYEQLALELALDPGRLTAVRDKLAVKRLTTPLFDTGLFTRHIEEAYRQAYQRYVDGEAPDTIFVRG